MSFNPEEPFSYAEGLAAGWSRRRLDACTRLGRGLLLDAEIVPTPRLRALAALSGLPSDAFVSHQTAARLLGLPLPAFSGEHATVHAVRDRRKGAGRTVHVVKGRQVVLVDGVRASAPLQIWSELAASLGFVDHVVLGDAIVARGWAEPTDFVAHSAGAYVRAGVESPMETRLRMLIVLAGLPEPEVNPEMRDDVGRVIRKYDLYYRRSRTAIEYDGRYHIEHEEQWSRDLGRRENAETDGDRILVMTSRDLYRDPARTLDRIAGVLRQRGEPGLPVRLRHEWRLHLAG